MPRNQPLINKLSIGSSSSLPVLPLGGNSESVRTAVDSLASATFIAANSAPITPQNITLTAPSVVLRPITTIGPVLAVLNCLLPSGTSTLLLPPASKMGAPITVVLNSTQGGSVNVNVTGNNTLVGTAPYSLTVNNPVTFVPDGGKKWYVASSQSSAGVQSIAASGSPGLTGNVVLAAGSNITLTQAGQTITIAGTASGGSFSLTRISAYPAALTGTNNLVVLAPNVQGTPTQITLPAATTLGQMIYIKNISGRGGGGTGITINVVAQSTDSLDATMPGYQYSLNPLGSTTAYNASLFYSDGNHGWWVLSTGSS